MPRRPSQRVVNVAATDTLVASGNPNRRGLLLSNCDPASTIYLSLQNPAVAKQGVVLPPSMRPEHWTYDDWGELLTAELHAVATLTAASRGPVSTNSTIAAAVSTAGVGDVAAFTVPAGTSAILTGATVANFVGGAPTIQLQLVRGATTVVLTSVTAATAWNTPIELQAADVIKWRCTTGVAATTVDASLTVDTFPSAGSTPATAPLVVLEIED